jgi:hypothetical protein
MESATYIPSKRKAGSNPSPCAITVCGTNLGPAEKRPSCRLQKRYSSSGDALKGHNEAVALAKGQVS